MIRDRWSPGGSSLFHRMTGFFAVRFLNSAHNRDFYPRKEKGQLLLFIFQGKIIFHARHMNVLAGVIITCHTRCRIIFLARVMITFNAKLRPTLPTPERYHVARYLKILSTITFPVVKRLKMVQT